MRAEAICNTSRTEFWWKKKKFAMTVTLLKTALLSKEAEHLKRA